MFYIVGTIVQMLACTGVYKVQNTTIKSSPESTPIVKPLGKPLTCQLSSPGLVKSGRKWTKGESRGLDNGLVWPELRPIGFNNKEVEC